MGESVHRASEPEDLSLKCKKLGVVFHTPENPTLGPPCETGGSLGLCEQQPCQNKKEKSAPGPVRGHALKCAHLPVGPLFPFPGCGK